MNILEIIQHACDLNATDVHLISNLPPMVRVNGIISPLPLCFPLTSEEIDSALAELVTDSQIEAFHTNLEMDFGCSIDGVGRIRGNSARERGSTSLVLRLLPNQVPEIPDLGLPLICRDLVERKNGLVIVSGATGSGKSTTLAAMINHVTKNASRRVVTIEDPIEYLYENQSSPVTQRELGGDTTSFAEALKHVLRQDPDVIMIGEMRDVDTASAALSIAETGHLVLSTGHGTSAYQAVERIIDLFPPYERDLASSRLASTLICVLGQILVPRADKPGLVVAVEVMLANPAVRNLIREKNTHLLPNTIRTHREEGMQLMDNALISLFQQNRINHENMMAFCHDKDHVKSMLNTKSTV